MIVAYETEELYTPLPPYSDPVVPTLTLQSSFIGFSVGAASGIETSEQLAASLNAHTSNVEAVGNYHGGTTTSQGNVFAWCVDGSDVVRIKVPGVAGSGACTNAIDPVQPVDPPQTNIVKIPVYRAAKYQGGYFYTSDVAEYNTVGQYGMRPEGLAFYITDVNTPGAVAVYRAAKLNGSGYFYTTDLAEYGTVSQYNMRPEGFAFYVMPASSNLYGEIPVYRGAHLVNEGYIYTSNWDEYANALPANGYRKENEVFRVFAG